MSDGKLSIAREVGSLASDANGKQRECLKCCLLRPAMLQNIPLTIGTTLRVVTTRIMDIVGTWKSRALRANFP